MIYYFAYGSNLDEQQMKERCPDSKVLHKTVLKDYRLDFTIRSTHWGCGCADVIKDKGKEVWGLLYRLSKKDVRILDRFEGNPNFYKRIEVTVIGEKGKLIKAHTYEAAKKSLFQTPSSEYLDIIKDASKKFNFPQAYQDYLKTIKYTP